MNIVFGEGWIRVHGELARRRPDRPRAWRGTPTAATTTATAMITTAAATIHIDIATGRRMKCWGDRRSDARRRRRRLQTFVEAGLVDVVAHEVATRLA